MYNKSNIYKADKYQHKNESSVKYFRFKNICVFQQSN
jgi:hypothetical protein